MPTLFPNKAAASPSWRIRSMWFSLALHLPRSC